MASPEHQGPDNTTPNSQLSEHATGNRRSDHRHSISGLDTLTQANAAHFSESAHFYEELPGTLGLARRVAGAMLSAYAFSDTSTRVLDFACGIGLLARELAPHARSIVGVDVSEGAVHVFNKRARMQGIREDEMRAVCTVLKGEDGELGEHRFDVVVCSMAYHHLYTPEHTTRVLARFLKPGGTLLVVDLMPRSGIDDSAADAVRPVIADRFADVVPHRHGFSEERMRTMFEDADLKNFEYKRIFYGRIPMYKGSENQPSDGDRRVDFFLASGEKPSFS
ncbi:S-adenosyl-L-methionine-dependent methyltransferase [Vararia minispora EC-137]|uniref:S-adenosyl-L-methionine-dependent methyltransferase n=1 Tax=Vararia minispora EC-137 TaxID=1314806 RepID=A0ACB8QUZ2_9AGAM|nr:S-adenosyl-L-methionine-dependent methyltransferase [Vararia minispora EC-137]